MWVSQVVGVSGFEFSYVNYEGMFEARYVGVCGYM